MISLRYEYKDSYTSKSNISPSISLYCLVTANLVTFLRLSIDIHSIHHLTFQFISGQKIIDSLCFENVKTDLFG